VPATFDPLDLTGRVAVVTGGTRGVGLAIARHLCTAGCEVLLNYAGDTVAAERAIRELSGCGGKAHTWRGDITAPDAVDDLLDETERVFGRLDIFVHNAAVFHPIPTTGTDRAGSDVDMAVALGPLLHGAARLARLLPPGTGRIIAISSTGARAVVPGYLGLGMAKSALEALVRYLAVEFASNGVAVNAIAAGKLDKGDGQHGPVEQRVLARTPAGRLTTARDVAGVVAMLCRAEAGALHGQVITIDGGMTLLA
jgi:enoyl-[acyl-carrier protein] reductase III